MITTEKLKESAAAGKAGETTANGERGSQAHGTDGAQAETLTATGIARLLKSDLAEVVEEEAGDSQQTESGAESEQTQAKAKAEAEKRKAAEAAEAAKNPEAQEQVEAWTATIAEIEERLAGAEAAADQAKIQQELEAAKVDLAEWEQRAKGLKPEGDDVEVGPTVPEALQSAIEEWEAKGGGELPPGLQGLVGKRIDKLTSQRETEKTARVAAEARVAALETEVEGLKANGAGGTPSATSLPDLRELATMERNGAQLVEELEAVADGTATEEEAARVGKLIGSERLDSDDAKRAVKRQLRQVQKFLAGIPAERQRVQVFRSEEAKVAPIAKAWFPFLFDKADADYQEAQAVLAVMPGLRTATPNHQIALGTYILGLRELRRLHPEILGKNGAVGTPRPTTIKLPRKAPVKSPASGGGAAAPTGARVKGREAEERAARQRFEQKPTKTSVTELLKVSLRT